jgi:hypothetical protein
VWIQTHETAKKAVSNYSGCEVDWRKMKIETVAAPPFRVTRPKFGDMIDALQTAGEWIRVPLSEINGGTRHQKQLAVQQAARQARIRVATHLDNDHIYVSRKV